MAGRDQDHKETLFGFAGHMVVVVVRVLKDKDVIRDGDVDEDIEVVGAGGGDSSEAPLTVTHEIDGGIEAGY